MPNHCSNILTCEDGDFGSVIQEFLSYNDADNMVHLDFDKIVPMPKELDITASFNPKDVELQEQYKINLEKFGFQNWYDWRVENWGTKWNSYDCNMTDFGMSFCTAWSPPEPVIKELAKITGKTFVLEYMEEGEAFIGRYTASPDEVIDECYELPDGPQELKDSFGWEPWEEEDEDLELTK